MVNETNRGLLVETLRSIAEILIWGDQNDSRVFEYHSSCKITQKSSLRVHLGILDYGGGDFNF